MKKAFGYILPILIATVCVIAMRAVYENPFQSYALMKRGVRVPTTISDCRWESVENDVSGESGVVEVCRYSFDVDGKLTEGITDDPGMDEVTYIPEDPAVHQLSSRVATSLGDWLFRRVFLMFALLAIFAWMPLWIVRQALHDLKIIPRRQ